MIEIFSNNSRSSRRARRLLFLLLAVGSGTRVVAEEKRDPINHQIWINPGAYSLHFDRDKNLREDNTGLGAEFTLTEQHSLAAGTFINSNRKRSSYGAYYWRPLRWHSAGTRVAAGIALGAFDGYPNYRNGAWFPAALPMIAIEGEHLGANIFFVPTIKNRLDGAISIQFKLRVW
jgi:hypothetical protein